ncbi:hypothetical protein PCG10_001916 [Penicillium crustosum]|uniref:HMG box domain-containing protein n=1 Tax=Penicillium crustosum TaxID=36656 RepID=A0A9P5GNY3_PENCR|nr:uncharacterized protein N7487_003115 [Penicillium crustosum]KAF7527982.1 hypothetical protein PCG10_001916 [Penicillium crustosum]KAJ5419565.1 hypothetical protein N7487_003115 [Penicillium crustosum]
MSWQSAARGGFVRTLHRSALPVRTGVSDLQNQLSRISLAVTSGSARPQFQPISSIQSLFQANSFATASTPLKATKTPKAKTPKTATSKSKKTPLSEKQKEALKAKQQRAHIKELKATALVRPKRLVTSAYGLAMTEKLQEVKGQYPVKEAWSIGVQHATSLSPQEKERLQAQVDANRAANAAAYDAWVKSHTPLQIKDANTARLTLSRIGKKTYPAIKDDRLPKIPQSAYIIFVTKRMETLNYEGKSVTEAIKVISAEWTELPQSEKDHYHKLQVEDRQRYEKEHQEVYGEPAPKSSVYKTPEDYN